MTHPWPNLDAMSYADSSAASGSASSVSPLYRISRPQLEGAPAARSNAVSAREPAPFALNAHEGHDASNDAPCIHDPSYLTSLSDAEMGIVAEYGAQKDKLRLRLLNDALNREVGRKIETLTLPLNAAISLLEEAKHFPRLKQLHVMEWHDEALIALTTTLRACSHPPFQLILQVTLPRNDVQQMLDNLLNGSFDEREERTESPLH